MDDTIAIALKIIPERVRWFGKLPPTEIRRTQTKSAEHYPLFGLGCELFDSARSSRRLIRASQGLKQLLRFSGVCALERLREKQLRL